MRHRTCTCLASLACVTLLAALPLRAQDALPSWNDVASKRALLEFASDVSTPGGPNFVPKAERVAVFDNDGTLWAEQPMYFQLAFALDRVKVLAPQHPEWEQLEPFASLLEGNLAGALAGGEKALLQIVMATHAGMTTDEYAALVSDWIVSARHPSTGRLYTEMVYQPMLELLTLLRAHGFKTYIVSGGGIDFMRVFAERVYGVPPEQVIGSQGKLSFELRDDGQAVLLRLPELASLNDKDVKPVNIQQHIGRRPIAAFGNSDGDLAMLQYATSGPGLRLGLIVHHTDAEREWAYDRQSHIGRLDKALDAAGPAGWTVVDMQADWAEIFPQARR